MIVVTMSMMVGAGVGIWCLVTTITSMLVIMIFFITMVVLVLVLVLVLLMPIIVGGALHDGSVSRIIGASTISLFGGAWSRRWLMSRRLDWDRTKWPRGPDWVVVRESPTEFAHGGHAREPVGGI